MIVLQSVFESQMDKNSAGSSLKLPGVGDTEVYENRWSLHVYASSIKITDMVNAGKRGKKVTVYTISGYERFEGAVGKILLDKLLKIITPNLKASGNVSDIKDAFEVFQDWALDNESLYPSASRMSLDSYEERGVDVPPLTMGKLVIETPVLSIRADPLSFTVSNPADTDNMTTCISMRTSRRSTKAFYDWAKKNESRLRNMKFSEVLREMDSLGVVYHQYCAMD